MKISKIPLLLLILFTTISAQDDSTYLYKNNWTVGAGVIYPRYMTISKGSIASHRNVGAYLSLGYTLSEHIGIRVKPTYILLHSFYYNDDNRTIDNFTNMGTIDFNAVYDLYPCEIISPYFILGFGATYFKSNFPYKSDERPEIKNSHFGYQASLGIGANFNFWDDFNIHTELNYITASNNKIDGNDASNEIKGLLQSNGDSYMALSIGTSWYFDKTNPSNLCNPPRLVIKEVPIEILKVDTVYIKEIKQIRDTVYVEKESDIIDDKIKNINFSGINFENDKAIFKPESYPILAEGLETLRENPDVKIEIQGHTDSKGSEKYNLKLSQRRADAVKNYFIENGIKSNRLVAKGFGETKPIADNNTVEGRAKNRRIEIKILDK